jgi:two-component system phosphate regulon sensor histidine kinase PhoR
MWRFPIFWRQLAALVFCQLLMIVCVCGMLAAQSTPIDLGGLGIVAALAIPIGLILALWLTRGIVVPVSEMTEAAKGIAAGEHDQKVFAGSHDEIGTLAGAFNRMSEQLVIQVAELEEDRQQLRTILSAMVEGVVALDADERILFANERASELLGFQTHQAVGRRLWEIVRQRTLQDVVRSALQGEGPCRGEFTATSGIGKNLTIHAVGLPGQPPRGAVLVLHDTTELRRLERVRQEFVANVSHELKTPLSVITACVETLLDGAADDPQHRVNFLAQIADQAQRLHALILDLLSLARIETGTEVFEFDAVPLEPLVLKCLEEHKARAESKNQTLEGVRPGSTWEMGDHWDQLTAASPQSSSVEEQKLALSAFGTEVAAWVDNEAARQILDNLVDNALKYTPAGGHIWVRWRAEDDQVVLEVEDTGIGIPELDLPRVFERFYRADKARSRELGGTGLGLSIVKHLVQAMHGSVRATSRLGLGTMFHVRLPRAPAV